MTVDDGITAELTGDFGDTNYDPTQGAPETIPPITDINAETPDYVLEAISAKYADLPIPEGFFVVIPQELPEAVAERAKSVVLDLLTVYLPQFQSGNKDTAKNPEDRAKEINKKLNSRVLTLLGVYKELATLVGSFDHIDQLLAIQLETHDGLTIAEALTQTREAAFGVGIDLANLKGGIGINLARIRQAEGREDIAKDMSEFNGLSDLGALAREISPHLVTDRIAIIMPEEREVLALLNLEHGQPLKDFLEGIGFPEVRKIQEQLQLFKVNFDNDNDPRLQVHKFSRHFVIGPLQVRCLVETGKLPNLPVLNPLRGRDINLSPYIQVRDAAKAFKDSLSSSNARKHFWYDLRRLIMSYPHFAAIAPEGHIYIIREVAEQLALSNRVRTYNQ